jgi:hypothetical protein
MGDRYDKAHEFLTHATEIFDHSYEDQKRALEAQVTENLNEAIEGGWMTFEEAEEALIAYRATLWGNTPRPPE